MLYKKSHLYVRMQVCLNIFSSDVFIEEDFIQSEFKLVLIQGQEIRAPSLKVCTKQTETHSSDS